MQQKNKESRGKDMIKIAVLGYGTVGSGVVEVIEKNKDMVNKKAGEELSIKDNCLFTADICFHMSLCQIQLSVTER